MVKLSREQAFSILDVAPDTPEEEIKKAYKKLALKWHPDKNPNDTEAASAKFKEVYAAYQKLTQPEEEEDEFEMDEDLSDAFSFFMYMMQMQMGGMRGGYGAPRGFPGGGGFGFTFMGGGGPFGSMGGGPSVFGGSRTSNFFTDDGYELYEDDDDDDYYHSQYSRAEQRRAEQQWQRDRRAERSARRREKEAAANAELNRKRAERAEQERVAREERRQRQQAQAAKVPKQTPEDIAAQHEEEVRKQLPKLPRPTMLDRTESSISLNLARKKESQVASMWEVSYHALHDPNWISIKGANSEPPVVCKHLQPGTKYVFKARAGQHTTPSKVVWGEWSVESQYVTVGEAAAPASAAAAAAPVAAVSKKSRKKAADKKGEKKTTGVSAQQAAFDEQAAIQQLKAEQEKEAARAAAVERAAAEYAAEAAKLQAPKAAAAQEAEAKKAKKKRNKHKKAPLQPENSEPASEQKENRSQQPNSYPTQAQRQTPTPTPAPAPYPSGARDFGLGLPGQGPAQHRSNQAAAARPQAQHRPSQAVGNNQGSWAQSELGLSPADMERLNIQEAIQISQALEESMRMYEEENRRAPPDETLAVDEEKFPSLPGGPPVTPPRPPLAAPKPQQHQHTSSSPAAKPQQPSTGAGPSGTASGQGRNLNQVSWDGSLSQRPANSHVLDSKQDSWAVSKQNGWDTDPDDQQADPVPDNSLTTWQNPGQSQTNWPNPGESQTNWQNPEPNRLQNPGQGQQQWGETATRQEDHWPQKRDSKWVQPEDNRHHQQKRNWEQPQSQQQSGWEQPQSRQQSSWEQPQSQQQGSWEQPQYQGIQEQPQYQGVQEQPQQQADWTQHYPQHANMDQSYNQKKDPYLQQESSWDQPYNHKDWEQPQQPQQSQQQGIWQQPQGDWAHTKQLDSTEQQQQGSWEQPQSQQQGSWDQPQYKGSWQQPQQQGTWDQPTQDHGHKFWDAPHAASKHQAEHHQSLNQGGWDAPNQDSGYPEGRWGEGFEQPPGIPGLNWPGHGGNGPDATGQTQWEPTPDSFRSGLTTASLAHHDKLTGADIRKAERQKASIDKWNQEGTDSSVANQQPGHWSHRQNPLISHHEDHPGTRHDHPGQIQDDQHQGHQSLLDPHSYSAPPVQRYDPYDLSPANLAHYPANSADPVGFGHHAADNGDSFKPIATSGYFERVSKEPEYADGNYDQGYSHEYHDPHDIRDANDGMYNNSYEPYRPSAQHAQRASAREQYSSQNRQQPHQTRASSSAQSHKPSQLPLSQSYTKQSQDYTEQPLSFTQQPHSQPLPASGWDDDLPEQNAVSHPVENGHMGVGESHADESSKWSAPIDSDQRQREWQGRGRGRGGGRGRKRGGQQQKSNRPTSAHQQQQDSHEVQRPRMQSTHMMSEADALKLMHQGHSHPQQHLQAHQSGYQHGSTSHGSRSSFPSHGNAGSQAGASLFVPDLFPREVR